VTSHDPGWDGGHLHYFTPRDTEALLRHMGFAIVERAASGGAAASEAGSLSLTASYFSLRSRPAADEKHCAMPVRLLKPFLRRETFAPASGVAAAFGLAGSRHRKRRHDDPLLRALGGAGRKPHLGGRKSERPAVLAPEELPILEERNEPLRWLRLVRQIKALRIDAGLVTRRAPRCERLWRFIWPAFRDGSSIERPTALRSRTFIFFIRTRSRWAAVPRRPG